MNILFDVISLQDYHNGGEEYVRAVLRKLTINATAKLYGVYDSNLKFLDNDETELKEKMQLFDIQSNRLSDITSKYKIDTFFIGIGQRFRYYDLQGINCNTICVIHDIGDFEYANGIYKIFPLKKLKSRIRRLLSVIPIFSYMATIRQAYLPLSHFIARKNVSLITVSEYTKNAIHYYLPLLSKKKITVLYPPQKHVLSKKETADDLRLSNLIKSKLPYILLLNANRENKNAQLAFKVFQHIYKDNPHYKMVVTGIAENQSTENVYTFRYLSPTDIELAYKNAYALVYPSYVEGFGYPPIEAMKYGTPVLSANVCSMPEVLKDAVIYFSPYNECDLYGKFFELQYKYEEYKNKAISRYAEISKKQIKDLDSLIDMIYNRVS